MDEWGTGKPTWRCRQVAPDVLQVSVPRVDGYVNVYLFGGENGWTLVDTAEDSELSRRMLFDFFETRHVLADGISQIFLTHGHRDHTGLAEEIAKGTGAIVVAHEAALAGPTVDLGFLQRHGLVPAPGEALRSPPVRRLSPERLRLVENGDILEAGRHRFRLLWTPGHQRGNLCAFDPKTGLLISGDRLLRVPTGVSLWSESDDDPLGDHLRSFGTLRELEVRLVLPGHGRPFPNAQEALEDDRRAHLVDLRLVLEAIPAEGADAATVAVGAHEIAGAVNRGTIGTRTGVSALAHTLATLRLLERQGQVRSDESARPVRFERAAVLDA